MSKLDWLTQEIDGLKGQGLYNRIRTIGSAQGARLIVDGKEVLNFCSNNYLGLANHPKIVEAAQLAIKKYGVGPAAVRSIAGTTDLHIELEKRLAKFKGAEDVITFQSGYTANIGTISALKLTGTFVLAAGTLRSIYFFSQLQIAMDRYK